MSRLPQLQRSLKHRANELRIMADMEVREDTSRTLHRIADDYERMAECSEAIERSRRCISLN